MKPVQFPKIPSACKDNPFTPNKSLRVSVLLDAGGGPKVAARRVLLFPDASVMPSMSDTTRIRQRSQVQEYTFLAVFRASDILFSGRTIPVLSQSSLVIGFMVLSCFCFARYPDLHAQSLEVSPDRVMVDESATIIAKGLQPSERVTIQAQLVDGGGATWASSADFVADAQGVVDLSKQAPVEGSYKHVSPMGLIWSMMPRDKDKRVSIYRGPANLDAQVTNFQLMRNGQPAASAQLEQESIGPDVRQIKVEGAVHGVFFAPKGSGPYPAVLVLGGSNGGAPVRQAAWLASRGFAAFALAYFRYENLPAKLEAIPLEYFGSALVWMMKRPEIAKDRIAVMGTSRGGELALQLGSMYTPIKAVVAYVPANTLNQACCGGTSVPYAWTWKGSPLPYITMRTAHDLAAMRAATIRVESTQGPVLLISGENDGVWESGAMADAVVARLKQVHFPYRFENLKYPHAGHTAGHVTIEPAWHGRVEHPVSGEEMNLGGTVEGKAESSLDATPKVLAFLRQSLQESASEEKSARQPSANATPTVAPSESGVAVPQP